MDAGRAEEISLYEGEEPDGEGGEGSREDDGAVGGEVCLVVQECWWRGVELAELEEELEA